jgi:hypothetical protein
MYRGIDMVDVINKDITTGGLNITELVGISIAKPIVERTSSKIIGNGTIVSGGAKVLGAFAAQKMLPEAYGINNIVAGALGVDGAEDLIVSVGAKAGLGTTAQQSEGLDW